MIACEHWTEERLGEFADAMGWDYVPACDEVLLLLENEDERRAALTGLDAGDGTQAAVLRGLRAERLELLAALAHANSQSDLELGEAGPKPARVELRPTTLRRANDFVAAHHRHNGRTARNGGKFAVCAVLPEFGDAVVGVVIVGNPLSATFMDGRTAEVTRLCVAPAAPHNTCSRLYGAAVRIWKEMGGARMVTYTLATENGASLRASGWKLVAHCPPTGDRWQSKGGTSARQDQAIYRAAKVRWEKAFGV